MPLVVSVCGVEAFVWIRLPNPRLRQPASAVLSKEFKGKPMLLIVTRERGASRVRFPHEKLRFYLCSGYRMVIQIALQHTAQLCVFCSDPLLTPLLQCLLHLLPIRK